MSSISLPKPKNREQMLKEFTARNKPRNVTKVFRKVLGEIDTSTITTLGMKRSGKTATVHYLLQAMVKSSYKKQKGVAFLFGTDLLQDAFDDYSATSNFYVIDSLKDIPTGDAIVIDETTLKDATNAKRSLTNEAVDFERNIAISSHQNFTVFPIVQRFNALTKNVRENTDFFLAKQISSVQFRSGKYTFPEQIAARSNLIQNLTQSQAFLTNEGRARSTLTSGLIDVHLSSWWIDEEELVENGELTVNRFSKPYYGTFAEDLNTNEVKFENDNKLTNQLADEILNAGYDLNDSDEKKLAKYWLDAQYCTRVSQTLKNIAVNKAVLIHNSRSNFVKNDKIETEAENSRRLFQLLISGLDKPSFFKKVDTLRHNLIEECRVRTDGKRDWAKSVQVWERVYFEGLKQMEVANTTPNVKSQGWVSLAVAAVNGFIGFYLGYEIQRLIFEAAKSRTGITPIPLNNVSHYKKKNRWKVFMGAINEPDFVLENGSLREFWEIKHNYQTGSSVTYPVNKYQATKSAAFDWLNAHRDNRARFIMCSVHPPSRTILLREEDLLPPLTFHHEKIAQIIDQIARAKSSSIAL
jgi:hypothetical protein